MSSEWPDRFMCDTRSSSHYRLHTPSTLAPRLVLPTAAAAELEAALNELLAVGLGGKRHRKIAEDARREALRQPHVHLHHVVQRLVRAQLLRDGAAHLQRWQLQRERHPAERRIGASKLCVWVSNQGSDAAVPRTPRKYALARGS